MGEDARFRVLIDATPLLLRSAGIKNYLYYWIDALRREAAPSETIGAFPWIGHLGRLQHDGSSLDPLPTLARLALLYFVNLGGNPAIHWIARSADVFHVTNQIRQPVRARRLTATIHDLTCWIVPEFHTPATVRADQAYAEHILKRADALIAVSECTRRDAVRLLGIPEGRIEVIYSGVPNAFFETRPEQAGAAARRYHLAKPYALFVGTIEPRKNLEVLLDAWQALGRSTRAEFDLVIAGPTGWAPERTVRRLVSAGESVRVLGYVPEGDLAPLTAGATVFVYPSLYEGFGFPVAQAMAAGVPVVTSDVSALPEVAGDGALLVDPRSVSDLRSAIEALLLSPSLRSRLRAGGARLASRYRWQHCAERSLAFFRRVGGCDIL